MSREEAINSHYRPYWAPLSEEMLDELFKAAEKIGKAKGKNMEDFRIKYGCMKGCNRHKEQGIIGCNDCITEWQLYLKEFGKNECCKSNNGEKCCV